MLQLTSSLLVTAPVEKALVTFPAQVAGGAQAVSERGGGGVRSRSAHRRHRQHQRAPLGDELLHATRAQVQLHHCGSVTQNTLAVSASSTTVHFDGAK